MEKTFSESFWLHIVRAVSCTTPDNLWHALVMGALKADFGGVSVLVVSPSRHSVITSQHSAPLESMVVVLTSGVE